MRIWTGPEVREELARAYKILFALPVKDTGPNAKSGWWPSSLRSADEVEELRRQAIREGITARTEITPYDVLHMESLLIGEGTKPGWLQRFMSDVPILKRALETDGMWEAAGISMKSGCRRKSWAYSSYRRRRDTASVLLAERLTAAKVELPAIRATRHRFAA